MKNKITELFVKYEKIKSEIKKVDLKELMKTNSQMYNSCTKAFIIVLLLSVGILAPNQTLAQKDGNKPIDFSANSIEPGKTYAGCDYSHFMTSKIISYEIFTGDTLLEKGAFIRKEIVIKPAYHFNYPIFSTSENAKESCQFVDSIIPAQTVQRLILVDEDISNNFKIEKIERYFLTEKDNYDHYYDEAVDLDENDILLLRKLLFLNGYLDESQVGIPFFTAEFRQSINYFQLMNNLPVGIYENIAPLSLMQFLKMR